MPELPEVETVVRGLRPRVRGQRIERLEVRQPLVVRSPLAAFRRALRGARIEGVTRRGKYILLRLDASGLNQQPHYWIVHLGMTGRFYACKPEAERLKHTHVLARLSSGEELRYVDPRRFGKTLALRESELAEYFTGYGAEPLRVSFERFVSLFAGRRAPVKNLLLNQSLLRGVGNIYANEALFLAGLHPARPAGTLTQAELRGLHHALRQVLREAIAEQGTTVSDYRTAEDLPGEYQNHLRVYEREGEPCLRCGTPIRRLVLGGRSAHYCPQCQPRRGRKHRVGRQSRQPIGS